MITMKCTKEEIIELDLATQCADEWHLRIRKEKLAIFLNERNLWGFGYDAKGFETYLTAEEARKLAGHLYQFANSVDPQRIKDKYTRPQLFQYALKRIREEGFNCVPINKDRGTIRVEIGDMKIIYFAFSGKAAKYGRLGLNNFIDLLFSLSEDEERETKEEKE